MHYAKRGCIENGMTWADNAKLASSSKPATASNRQCKSICYYSPRPMRPFFRTTVCADESPAAYRTHMIVPIIRLLSRVGWACFKHQPRRLNHSSDLQHLGKRDNLVVTAPTLLFSAHVRNS